VLAPPAPQDHEAGRPDLRVVPRRRRHRAGIVAVALCIVMFGLLFAITAFQGRIAGKQMELDRAEQYLTEALDYQDRLRLEVARRESPDYVIARATTELGMTSPEQISYLSPTSEVAATVARAAGSTPPLDPAATPVVVPPADPSQLPG